MRGFTVIHLAVLGWAVVGCNSDSQSSKVATQMKPEVQHEKLGSGSNALPKTNPKDAGDLKVQVPIGSSREANPKEAKMAAEIKNLGGKVVVDENSPNRPVIAVSYWMVHEVTDAEVESLRGLIHLKELNLFETQVTGVEHLAGLGELEVLTLTSTPVADAGLGRLKELPSLNSLDLSQTKITNAGLAHLSGLSQLKKLYLARTKVTDVGLEHLQGLGQLEVLDLYGTQITDAGLRHLQGLSHLKVLGLYGPRFTDVALKKLQQALPNCKIER